MFCPSLLPSPSQERRLPPPVPKKPPKGPHHHPPLARDRSLESSEKQRQEARKRLMAAKRAASVRQNSATESADSIEIYIPEAQTRLWGHCQSHTGLTRSTHHSHRTQQMYGCPHKGKGFRRIWIYYFIMHNALWGKIELEHWWNMCPFPMLTCLLTDLVTCKCNHASSGSKLMVHMVQTRSCLNILYSSYMADTPKLVLKFQFIFISFHRVSV